MRIPALNPATDVVAPQGATHFELLCGAAALNFETGSYQVATVAAPLGINYYQQLNGKNYPLNGKNYPLATEYVA